MPELPEVEVLKRHLAPLLAGRQIHGARVLRARTIRPHLPADFAQALRGARLREVRRRGKFLLFDLAPRRGAAPSLLIGHLGMTGRMYLAPARTPLPKHTAVVIDLGEHQWVFEDPRYFGRLTLDASSIAALGPEPWDEGFSAPELKRVLRGSRQAIKVKLLDQAIVAGVGNIYASEALHRAGISPRRAAGRLSEGDLARLCRHVRELLEEAIRFGSTVPLDFGGARPGTGDGLFYYGRSAEATGTYEERLRVYDRANQPCSACGGAIRRIVQAARSTYYCPRCQT